MNVTARDAQLAVFGDAAGWTGWDRVPFTSVSHAQVAVFEKRP